MRLVKVFKDLNEVVGVELMDPPNSTPKGKSFLSKIACDFFEDNDPYLPRGTIRLYACMRDIQYIMNLARESGFYCAYSRIPLYIGEFPGGVRITTSGLYFYWTQLDVNELKLENV